MASIVPAIGGAGCPVILACTRVGEGVCVWVRGASAGEDLGEKLCEWHPAHWETGANDCDVKFEDSPHCGTNLNCWMLVLHSRELFEPSGRQKCSYKLDLESWMLYSELSFVAHW